MVGANTVIDHLVGRTIWWDSDVIAFDLGQVFGII